MQSQFVALNSNSNKSVSRFKSPQTFRMIRVLSTTKFSNDDKPKSATQVNIEYSTCCFDCTVHCVGNLDNDHHRQHFCRFSSIFVALTNRLSMLKWSVFCNQMASTKTKFLRIIKLITHDSKPKRITFFLIGWRGWYIHSFLQILG